MTLQDAVKAAINHRGRYISRPIYARGGTFFRISERHKPFEFCKLTNAAEDFEHTSVHIKGVWDVKPNDFLATDWFAI